MSVGVDVEQERRAFEMLPCPQELVMMENMGTP